MKKEAALKTTCETQNVLKVAAFTKGPVEVEFGRYIKDGPVFGFTIRATGKKPSIVSPGVYEHHALIVEEYPDEYFTSAEVEANGELIAEAFNVATETGLTPRKLADSHKELLAALKGLREVGGHIDLSQGLRLDAVFKNAFNAAKKAEANAERQS